MERHPPEELAAMSHPSAPPPADWYPDPHGGPYLRWWNGAAWAGADEAARRAGSAGRLDRRAAHGGAAPGDAARADGPALPLPPYQQVRRLGGRALSARCRPYRRSRPISRQRPTPGRCRRIAATSRSEPGAPPSTTARSCAGWATPSARSSSATRVSTAAPPIGVLVLVPVHLPRLDRQRAADLGPGARRPAGDRLVSRSPSASAADLRRHRASPPGRRVPLGVHLPRRWCRSAASPCW